jgi:hypothetical protein
LIVFDVDVRSDNGDAAESVALKQFLDQRDDLIQNRRVVVLAYGSPYYLDTTEISKVDAYYGIYSRVEPFIEASIRVFFREGEFAPIGASPVSIEAINYNLLEEQTAPNPDQTIDLIIYAINGVTETQNLQGTPGADARSSLPKCRSATRPPPAYGGHLTTTDTRCPIRRRSNSGLPIRRNRAACRFKKRAPDGVAQFTLSGQSHLAISVRSVNARTSKIIRLNRASHR